MSTTKLLLRMTVLVLSCGVWESAVRRNDNSSRVIEIPSGESTGSSETWCNSLWDGIRSNSVLIYAYGSIDLRFAGFFVPLMRGWETYRCVHHSRVRPSMIIPQNNNRRQHRLRRLCCHLNRGCIPQWRSSEFGVWMIASIQQSSSA